jgi:hypothetical protein
LEFAQISIVLQTTPKKYCKFFKKNSSTQKINHIQDNQNEDDNNLALLKSPKEYTRRKKKGTQQWQW